MFSYVLSVTFMMSLAVAIEPSEKARQQPAPAPMKCEKGLVKRKIGASYWLVYSCADGSSMVVVSAPGNPAAPFVFYLRKQVYGYVISGEGNGDRRSSDAAGNVLSKMSANEFAALLSETMQSVP